MKHRYSASLDVVSEWEEFYTRARALRNKGRVEFSGDSYATVTETIEKVDSYGFPKEDDPTLHAACKALSEALQNAGKAKVEYDTAEVKQALDNLRKAYDEAAKSNTVMVRYIDVEPPSAPFSPLLDRPIKPILLARPWMKELISMLHDERRPFVVIGNPGSGKSVALVGYLLFYLIARGERVILQSETSDRRLGYVFDEDGVREVSRQDAEMYNDGRPCYLLVSADGPEVCPQLDFYFCNRFIVVTPPNIMSKPQLNHWKRKKSAELFIAPPPSCHEVVYLLSQIEKIDSYIVYWMYREWTRDFRRCIRDCKNAISHLERGTLFEWYEKKTRNIMSLARMMLSGGQEFNMVDHLSGSKTYLTIPSDLVTMERFDKRTDEYNVVFATPRIAEIVADVQEEKSWIHNFETSTVFFSSPETHMAIGRKFQKMLLRVFQEQGHNGTPPCYELGETTDRTPR